MAKYTLGSGVFQFKGSRGGSVFQRSGTTFSIRSRKKPRFQRTPRNSQSRSNFHAVQSVYPTLSPAQKTSWADQTSNFTRVNSLGEVYELLPINLHGSQNKNLADSQLPLVSTGSAPVSFPSISSVDYIFEISPIEITPSIVPLTVPSDFRYVFRASRALESVPVDPSQVSLVTMIEVNEGLDSDVNFGPIWESRFGLSSNLGGLFCVIELQLFSIVTGQSISNSFSVIELDV